MSPNNADKKLGKEMRKLRETSNVSIRLLAKTMGYSAPYVLDLETGKRSWFPETNPDLKNFYLTTLEKLKKNRDTGKELRALRESLNIPLKVLAGAMGYNSRDVSALERGKADWTSEDHPDLREFYLSNLEKLKHEAASLEEDKNEENLRDLKIKQIVVCLDGCSEEVIDKVLAMTEESYLEEISQQEELDFYHQTIKDIKKNNFPLNREFIYK